MTSGSLRALWHSGERPFLHLQRSNSPWPTTLGGLKLNGDQMKYGCPLKEMELDLGGVVKEYAADTIIEGCFSHGVRSGLVNLGGDIRCIGQHPDGSPWPVSVKHPFQPGAIAKLLLEDRAIASSGGYERFIEIEGKRFAHVIDPRNGWPVDGLAAVSVLADKASDAVALQQ